ncbi:TPM domain-containing protein [Actinomadura barringtoniae]|uniref:TPM domain-containing protein n=1 Tax=Actinomadura barringtoniae TaxID=1427535 RepID=A0A939T899_9ACTN|nr:TPM domain-containing protein [Actinomadura barringtoniae]MBO2446680.1 TPM domain-containing protein [Actinomadura barringtoniae]
MFTWSALGGVIGLLFAALWGTGTAVADQPFAVQSQITDRVGALGDRRAEVQQALDRLTAQRRVQLLVVYVKDFSGSNAQTWADRTAQQSGIGRRDLLMAVGTSARQYAVSADQNFALTDAQLDEVASVAIEPALRQNDWAGAAIGAADGYDAALGGQPIPAPQVTPGTANPSGDSGPSPLVWILPVGAGVAAGGAFLYVRSRQRRGDPSGGALGPDGRPAPTLDELDRQAGQLLVQTDDAIKTSEQEVGFAQAQFGAEAAAPFAEAVAFAKEQLDAAFRVRQRLDDSEPETPEQRRAMLEEILARCQAADQRLDAQSAAFDRLRDLEKNAPQVLAQVQAGHQELATKVGTARQQLAELASRYTTSALELVKTAPDEAQSRLDFARDNLDRAGNELRSGTTAQAAVHVQAAESAVGQARELLDAVDRHAHELSEASQALDAAIKDTTDDLATAQGLLSDERWRNELAPHVTRAAEVTSSVQQELARGPADPLAELRRLQEANQALDQALDGVRDRQAREKAARAQLDQAVLAARGEISASTDFINTHRGAVGSTPRTRLAEAQRLLAKAVELATTDPVSALSSAEQAGSLANEAGQLARQDIGGTDPAFGPMGGGGGGGRMADAMIGGILIDSILNSGRRSGGSRPAPTPGSFGGTATRGRRGAGGRF